MVGGVRAAAARNIFKAWLLVLLLAALFAGLGWLLADMRGAVLFAFCSLLAASAAYAVGDRALLGMLGARPFALAEDPLLRSTADRLAAQLGILPPKLQLIDDRPTGDPHIGVLLIASDENSLSYLQMPMELVASQAALAIERIMLSNEITRHNSEQYFRTLVHNAADVILIIEPDTGRIRYASPSAQTVFGTAELTGKNLSELVAGPHDTAGEAVGVARFGCAGAMTREVDRDRRRARQRRGKLLRQALGEGVVLVPADLGLER